MGFDVSEIRKAFPIFNRSVHGKRLVFLDSAASAQKPQVVIDAMTGIYTHSYANVHRGIYALAEEATEAYESTRHKVAKFINAPEPETVINVRNATEGINLVAYAWGNQNIGIGDRIIITEMEHHSNLVPWQQLAQRRGAELVYLPVTAGGELDLSVLPSLLAGGKTKLVACSLMSNVLGTVPPVKELVAAAHKAGALVLLDGAQAVPHIPVDVQDLGCDFLVFSGHKLGAPGVGILWARRELLEAMPPFLYGGDMILSVDKYASTWNDLPYKFEAGTPAIAEVVGLGAAIDFLSDLGMTAIHHHEQALVRYAFEHLSGIPGLQIYGPPPGPNRGGAVSFTLQDIHPHDIASILDEEGICVRAGLHCAEPLHTRFGLHATARASFYIYNDAADVDSLVEGLRKVVMILGRK
ncbi:MAG: SufS family cysteine desulfurase [Anaerolineae bacterium]|nr:SufS family cysteine desulfurase [Anaerolineae bacterium]